MQLSYGLLGCLWPAVSGRCAEESESRERVNVSLQYETKSCPVVSEPDEVQTLRATVEFVIVFPARELGTKRAPDSRDEASFQMLLDRQLRQISSLPGKFIQFWSLGVAVTHSGCQRNIPIYLLWWKNKFGFAQNCRMSGGALWIMFVQDKESLWRAIYYIHL
jgi:hypothetical protein